MPSPSVASQASSQQAATQFLNSVLSQRGPNALPYAEDVKWSIRQHLLAVVQDYPGLTAKTGTFTHNDGRASHLLKLEGTVPMFYQNVKYNIPITAWLLEGYPRQCPLVYVTPTRDMIIKPRHQFVDASGMVAAPYLREWVFPRSNLVDLCGTLSVLFGSDPPLYTRPSHVPARPPPPQQGFVGVNPILSGNSSPVIDTRPPPSGLVTRPPYSPPSGGRSGYASPPPQATPMSGTARPPTQGGGQWTDNPEEVFKRNAVKSLTERLQKDLASHNREVTGEIEGLFSTQALLEQRGATIEGGVRELGEEKEALEQALQVILTNSDVIETWLKVNDRGAGEEPADDIDAAFEPVDRFSRQLLESSAEDLAIEDLMYALDKAAQDGSLGAEVYLKTTRNLSREQFFHRATCIKVRAMQQQAQAQAAAPYARGGYR
ncbi:Vacuolar sorting protein/ubiquitin receptor VPS23 [Klebsormidium nitens]|uniref:Vacuolar sorting protein/ubiquitin receptor VPS23 n=1 Tax=Klebsormidium nitens TaxID=105231 RepID=A0A1Y1HW97_KLENI|nr:Vacuolar sorting protein/ubiquitin receptor VPS23 [Klebsormidium nitens]|eukprot:GAQ82072.1 Vacuolar sorting protein/ubiquitin receptor VPS23 [Klebsormidium nitens]